MVWMGVHLKMQTLFIDPFWYGGFNACWTELQITMAYGYTLIVFDKRKLFGSNVPSHSLVCVCLLHCMHEQLCNVYTQAYPQIMQHTHMHKAVTGRVDC